MEMKLYWKDWYVSTEAINATNSDLQHSLELDCKEEASLVRDARFLIHFNAFRHNIQFIDMIHFRAKFASYNAGSWVMVVKTLPVQVMYLFVVRSHTTLRSGGMISIAPLMQSNARTINAGLQLYKTKAYTLCHSF